MMDCTDRHFRFLMRLITRHTLLYTEMITSGAIIHGDRQKLLGYCVQEHPLALQVGGSHPADLALCAKIAEDYGYAEINLNVGCPSDRVQAGEIGVCLMKQPGRVAECVAAMQAVVSIPVTVKCRIGVDHHDSYEFLTDFIQQVSQASCQCFILHARKAWLHGLSPKENRTVPPLCYDRVYQLKRDYADLEIIINGGINHLDEFDHHLQHVDGVMIGRQAYSNPFTFAEVDQRYWRLPARAACRNEVLVQYMEYVREQVAQGVPIRLFARHLMGFFQGKPGAKKWRRMLAEECCTSSAELSQLERIVTIADFVVQKNHGRCHL